MIASWRLLSFLKAADTRQNASFAVRKKSKLSDDIPDDPLSALQSSRQAAEHTMTIQADSPKKKGRKKIPSGNQQENQEDEILRFLSQFDSMETPEASEEEPDEIESFLSQFDEIPDCSEREDDWRNKE